MSFYDAIKFIFCVVLYFRPIRIKFNILKGDVHYLQVRKRNIKKKLKP